MSTETTLGDFLSRLKDVYKSVDIRIAAIKSSETWHNALSVVRFSYMNSGDLADKQKETQDKWVKAETDRFRIYMEALPLAELEHLNGVLHDGKWYLLPENTEVQYGRGIDLLGLKGQFGNYGYTRREEHSWPCFEAMAGQHCPNLDNPQVQSEVKSHALIDIYSLISELLEVNLSRSLDLDLIVNVPIYALIESVDFAEQKCKVRVKFHKDVRDLAVSALVRKGDRDDSPVRDKAGSTIILEKSQQLNEYFRLWEEEFELPRTTPVDYLSVGLLQTKPVALDIEKPAFPTQIFTFIRSKTPVNAPLITALARFCSLDKLEDYLSKPSRSTLLRKSKNDVSASFELAIAWLLGACGFNTVWLGQTDHEICRDNEVALFSVDILAAHHQSENSLFLIGCTSGPPNDKDIDNLKSARKVLAEELFKGAKMHLQPLIFSGAAELGNKERDGVKLLDAGDLRGIVTLLRQNEIKRALNKYLGNELGFRL